MKVKPLTSSKIETAIHLQSTILYTLLVILFLHVKPEVKAQFLMDMIDTTTETGKSLLSLSKKFDRIRIGGYIQAQFQVASKKGINSYSGGDFPTNSNNRFMLRRGRVRFDYAHFPEQKGPSVQFALQFDGSERGVAIRDFYGRISENKFKLFAVTGGMFARPFSYELNLSSGDRETPERGRMSQILMKSERDLGVMLSVEPRGKNFNFKNLKFDIGIFNGQGLTAPTDFDSHKDLISRLSLKPYKIAKSVFLSFGLSTLQGGLLQNTPYVFLVETGNNGKFFSVDSSLSNKGKTAPRKYYGADAQLKFKTHAGATELRAEFMKGKQTGFSNTSETLSALPQDLHAGFYRRNFNGAYFYLLHNFISKKHQLVIKYDWYDPNVDVEKLEVGLNNLNAADIKYRTIGFGYTHHFDEVVKLIIYYDRVINEKTSIPAFSADVSDDVFTARLQFKF